MGLHGSSRRAFFAVLIVVGCCGCARQSVANRPGRVPVTGAVYFRNEPVEGATVVFHPQNHPHAAAGQTQTGGVFCLRTYDPGDGAVPGTYQVTIRKFYFEGNIEHQLLPQRYGYPQASKLSATVVSEGKNSFRFDLVE